MYNQYWAHELDLNHMTKLKTLIADGSCCRLKEESISKLKLQKLAIEHITNLDHMADTLTHLATEHPTQNLLDKLTLISLESFSTTDIKLDHMATTIRELKYVNISQENINKLIKLKKLCTFKNYSLDFCKNKLKSLNTSDINQIELDKLTHLEKLDISNLKQSLNINKMSKTLKKLVCSPHTTEDDIKNLVNLEVLDIKNNKNIKTIPKLPKLRKIITFENDFENFLKQSINTKIQVTRFNF